MSTPKSVRLEERLAPKVEQYLKANNIKFPQLVNRAIEKYISEPQTIELVPVDSEEFLKLAEESYSEHKDAIDLLK